jgi:GNAT superfamily N-acetyltransferase
MLAVSGDGEYAYALRRRFENFYGQGDKETVSYRLMELNPFMDAGAGAETQEGFCEIYFHDAHKTAYLGMGSRMVLAVSKQGVGLGALLLQFALDEALSRGMQEIRISTAVRQAIPFYEKFGFRLVGPRGTEMVRDLTQRGSEKVMFPDAGAVHAFHNFGRIDFRGHQPQVTRALFSRITDNTVMRDFLDWEERLGMGTSYRDVILRLWKERNRLVREIFARVESLGEESIRQAGRDMLKEFNERPENREEDTTLDWLQLAARRTTGQYDLSQLLSQTLGMAYMYLQLKKKDYSEADLRKIKENTEECLHEGILILRAIALAEKEKEKKAEEEPWQSVRLPKLKAQAASLCVAEIIQEAI